MRKMNSKFGSVNVIEHIMTRNFWEYYITDDKFTDDIVRAVVVGDEVETGDVSLREIKPYIISRTKDLKTIMPAIGWRWV